MFRKQSNHLRALSIAALLMMGVVFVVWASFARELTSKSSPITDQASGTGSSGATATDDLEVELVTLRASGFEPLQITRPKGRFVLLLEDRSGKAASLFTLQQLKGGRLREVNTSRTRFEWHDVINLPPGDYVLANADSDSPCHITILP